MSQPAARGVPGGRGGRLCLLDADPELARGLTGKRLADARTQLIVRRLAPASAGWSDAALDRLVAGGLGILVVKGVLARELALSDNVTVELVGPGDLLRPSAADDPSRLLRSSVRWTVVEAPELAVLGDGAMPALAPYPEVYAELVDRLARRAHRLSVAQAISQLNGVDRRVLALFWHLAERWGQVGPDGVVVPLRLPHRIVAQLVGARRPTVSTALSALMRERRLLRLQDGGWLLRGEPVGVPVGEASRVVRLRHPRVPRSMTAVRG